MAVDRPSALTQDPSLVQLLRHGLAAARANLAPAAVLWTVAVAFVGGYYFVPDVADVLKQVAAAKDRFGFAFAVVSTVTFGGIIPWLVMRLRPVTRKQATLPTLLFFMAFWAEKGLEVDALYRLQTLMFGEAVSDDGQLHVGVIVLKTLFDQAVYVPLWAIPSTVIPYLWKDCGFSIRRTRAELGPRWYRRRILPVMLPNWGVWIPAVAVIYILPPALQLPLQNLVLCLWALMLIFLTTKRDTPV